MTCLVGKNEAGKTAILQALAGLNPHPATPFQYTIERDFPKRTLARYQSLHPNGKAEVIKTKWEISKDIASQISDEFGNDALTGTAATLSRGYGDDSPRWKLPISEAEAITHLVANSGFSAPEKSQVGNPSTTKELIAKLTPLAAENPKHKSLLDKVSGFPNASILSRARAICEPYLPQFMYFSNYDRMSAVVHLPTLQQRHDDKSLFSNEQYKSDRLFWEFLEFSGVSLNEILGATTFESFNARLQAASNTLTEEILEYWTQNPDIEVRVNVAEGKPGDPAPFNSGAIGRARIYNSLHKADTAFSERSAGFTWFFSFLIKFNQVTQESDRPISLLLDEPGLTLHGTAQADLLRFFEEKLTPHHQLIFSTHSPFMVPPNDLSASRIVEDLVTVSDRGRRTPVGTKVRADVLSTDRDSVFPLQGALGYSLTQTLFVGKHTILVEGPSDILYLKALSNELRRRGRTGLDRDWVICPSGGLDKINAFVSLFSGNELDVIALTDFAKKDRKKIEALRQSEILKSGGVLCYNDFVGKDEADVEDLLSPEVFVDIINGAYELTSPHTLTEAKLAAADDSTVRQVKQAEAFFRVLPNSVPEFDHFSPASWLIEHPEVLHGDTTAISETMDRAEILFKQMNDLKDE